MYLLPIIALEKVSHNRDIQLLFGLKKRSIGHEALLLLLQKLHCNVFTKFILHGWLVAIEIVSGGFL